MGRLLSLVLFTASLAILLAALRLDKRNEDPAECRSWSAHSLEQGQDIEFLLLAGSEPIVLHSRLRLDGSEDDQASYDYALQVSWIDSNSKLVKAEVHWEQSWALARAESTTAKRTTRLLPGPLAKTGGKLRVKAHTLPKRTLVAFVRAYQRKARTVIERKRLALALSEGLRRRSSERLGFASWSELTYSEREESLTYLWQTLPPLDHSLEKTKLWDCADEWERKQANLARQTLRPGRSLALSLRGPLRARLIGEAAIESLRFKFVGEQGAVRTKQTRDRHEATIDFLDEEVFSFHVENRGKRAISFRVALSRARSAPSFGLARMIPRSWVRNSDPETSFFARPEQRNLRLPRIGPQDRHPLVFGLRGHASQDVIRLSIRATLRSTSDKMKRRVSLHALDSAGKELWARSAEFLPNSTGYERGISEHDWLSEPVVFYVSGLENVGQIMVDSADELFVGLSVKGAEKGDPLLYREPEIAEDRARLRYAFNPLRSWHGLRPRNWAALEQSKQVAELSAMVRLEDDSNGSPARGSPTSAQSRSYQSLDPSGSRGAAPLFLRTMISPSPTITRIHCRFRPSPRPRAFRYGAIAARTMEGQLPGRIWSLGRALGKPYTIEFGEQAWKRGRLRQTLTRLRSARQGPVRRIRFTGPRGAELWLETASQSLPCAQPYRAVRAHLLEPGAELLFDIATQGRSRLLSFSGFARDSTTLEVVVDGGSPRLKPGLFQQLMLATQELTLPLREERVLVADRPTRQLSVLESKAVVLGASLEAATHQVRVRNIGSSAVYLRTALESEAPAPQQTREKRIRWVPKEHLR